MTVDTLLTDKPLASSIDDSALAVAQQLRSNNNVEARVVSFPCRRRFQKQSEHANSGILCQPIRSQFS